MSAETRTVTREHEEVTAVICDRCGKRYPQPTFPGGSVEVQFGYGSRYDMDRHEFDFCDDCAEILLDYLREKS